MKKYTPLEAVKILSDAAKQYRDKVAGRFFLIVYHDRQLDCMEYKKIKFSEANFRHLTGISYKDDVSAKDFFKMCLNNKLSKNKIIFRKDGFTSLKLAVLPHLAELFYHPFWLGDSINNDITINADYFAGDKKCVLSLGFRSAKEDYPISLKCQSIREVVKRENEVLVVYSRKIKDKGQWEEIYRRKDFDEEKLKKDSIYVDIQDILLK